MFPINDALDAILLGGFLFGLLFTVGALVLGVADVGVHSDTGDAGGHGGHGHSSNGFLDGMFNVSSLLAFITWFGGVGYIARNNLGLSTWLALLIGLVGGIVGGAVVTWVLKKLLGDGSETMDPKDWEQVGVLGRVSSSIRAQGYGEIVYEQNGIRQVASARAAGEHPIPRNTEVVVLRVERGVAIVEPFDELLRAHEERVG